MTRSSKPVDADKPVDVEVISNGVVLERWALPNWRDPAGIHEIGGVQYEAQSYEEAVVGRSGRPLYRLHVAPISDTARVPDPETKDWGGHDDSVVR